MYYIVTQAYNTAKDPEFQQKVKDNIGQAATVVKDAGATVAFVINTGLSHCH